MPPTGPHDAHMGRVERRIMGAIEVCRTASLGGLSRLARIAGIAASPTIPAATGIARSARGWRGPSGWPTGKPTCTSMSCSPCRPIMAFQNNVIYAILFQAAAETLRTIAADPRHLGAAASSPCSTHGGRRSPTTRISIASCRAPPDGARWIACRPNFFLPIHVPRRRLFLERLQAAFDAGRLRFFGDMARLAEARAFAAQTKRLRKISWVSMPNRRSAPPTKLHPSRGRQQPARGHPRPGSGSVARLSTGEPKQADDARRTRVHPPLPAPRPARRIPPHPSLRLPQPPEQARPDPAAARPTRTAANPPQRRLSRARARTDRRRSQSLPLLWRRHARHRYLAVHQSAANPASLVSRPMTIRHRARPNSVYAAVVPSRAAARQTACASRQIPDSAPSLAPPEPATPLARSRPAQIHGAIAFQTPSRRIPSPPEIDAATKSP